VGAASIWNKSLFPWVRRGEVGAVVHWRHLGKRATVELGISG